MNLTEEDKLCIPVPLYHCFGMVGSSLAVTHGGCIVLSRMTALSHSPYCKAVEEESVRVCGVPA
jgi:fatty-acyl-CoA synthase